MIGDILQPTHLLFILIVALIVLGPKRLPEVGKSLGKGLRDFRVALSNNEDAEQLREGFQEARSHLQETHQSLREPIAMQATAPQPVEGAQPPVEAAAVAETVTPAPAAISGEMPQPMAAPAGETPGVEAPTSEAAPPHTEPAAPHTEPVAPQSTEPPAASSESAAEKPTEQSSS